MNDAERYAETRVGHRIDFDSCAREPVHVIGHIQSHGLLFALSESDLIVRQVSANVEALLGVSPHTVLGHSLGAVLGPRQFALFRTRLRTDDLSVTSALRVVLGRRALEMDCVAHRHDGVLVVEFQLLKGCYSLQPAQLAATFQSLQMRMERESDILAYSRVAAGEIQRLSGFGSVMIYRFDTRWDGDVIAEASSVAESAGLLQSYLGLRFPASDIPAQARRLFLSNAVRALADVASTPVPIVPEIGPLTGRPLDLSYAFLRSSSQLHIEYLRNMGVRSSLTVSIVVEQRLWGMIACHHHAPRPVDCLTLSVCETIARNLALQVALLEAKVTQQSRSKSGELLREYAERMERPEASVDGESFRDAGFLELLDADGMVSRIGDVVSVQGVSAPEASLEAVIAKLRPLATRGIASSDKLSMLDPSAESYASEASGALYIGMNEPSGDYLLFLRREIQETVTWAGNPNATVSADDTGRLHPRASFEAWQDSVRACARPWTEIDLERARSLRGLLLRLQELQRLRELD